MGVLVQAWDVFVCDERRDAYARDSVTAMWRYWLPRRVRCLVRVCYPVEFGSLGHLRRFCMRCGRVIDRQ